jgi:hypothetical protein
MSSEKQPNNPLTGPETLQWTLKLIEDALRKEWVFNPGTSYPRVGVEIGLKFHFLSASMPKIEPKVRISAPLEPAPLTGVDPLDNQGVIAVKIEKTVENPNLERVHAGMPITVTAKKGAAPGQMFPTVEHHQVIYDKTDYPEPDPPKITDISKETASAWNVKDSLAPFEATTEPTPEPIAERSEPQDRSRRGTMGRKPRVVRVPKETDGSLFDGKRISTYPEPIDEFAPSDLDAVSVEADDD